MTNTEKNLIMQSIAFAQVYIKEADLASGGLPNQTHEAACQLLAALQELPPAICSCTCGCEDFQHISEPPTLKTKLEAAAVLACLPSYGGR